MKYIYKKSHNLSSEELTLRTIDFINIVSEPISENKYKESEGSNFLKDYLIENTNLIIKKQILKK